jgi:DNA-binding IscR family transcriptional regulator
VSLAEILTAIDGPGGDDRDGRKPSSRVLADVWREVHEAERAVLRATTLDMLMGRAAPAEWVI